ncbi:hypothetical protein [Bacteriovorax sp. Seq25_V]|uniref:hypothetical protein n=1 Tax=Bacteriovorax sp. Seq25_V TaxID=1201288 RepID=UPI00038A26FA|nr:hypothetical protein [Bacteriovorax sp. Seq25_V]EQC44684.1 hypothetical protein M900_0337 [Bacteriovorax sp. Seq25_V]
MKRLIVVASLIAGPVLADSRGEIGFNFTRYIHEKSSQDNQMAFSSFQVQDSSAFLGGNFYVDIVGKVNQTSRDNSYINFNELYYKSTDFFGNSYTAGYQVFTWSKMEAFHPANIVNSRYFDGDLEDFDKKGELTLSYSFKSLLGDLKLFYFPFFEKSFYPTKSTRITDGVRPEKSYHFDGNNLTEKKESHQYGISLQKQIGDFDFHLFALNHIDRNRPLLGYHAYTINPTLGAIPYGNLAAYYGEVLDYGMASTLFVDDSTFKLEFLGSKFKKSEKFVLSTGGFVGFKDQKTIAIGHEYSKTWDNGWDSTFFTEYQAVFADDSSHKREELSVFQNDLFLGHRLSLNDAYGKEFRFGVFYDLQRKNEMLFFLTYEQRLNDFWKFKTGIRTFTHDSNDKLGLYVLEKDDEVSFSLTRFF